MDLRTHYPYSLLRYGILHTYPSLKKDIRTDVLVIGAGISGALISWELHKKGFECIVTDKRHVATGSTAASTSLIQYEIDVPLHRLIKMVGEKRAVRAYELSRQAIAGLRSVCEQMEQPSLFEEKCSLQFASSKKDIAALEKEYDVRRQLGFKVDLLSSGDLSRDYHFNAPAALLSHEAGQLDAYVLTHQIFDRLPPGIVFDHTEIVSSELNSNGYLSITADGNRIHSRYLVIACGYESGKFLGKNIWEELRCTYAIISEIMEPREFWKDNCLIWETADPYLYMRICEGNRILIGGKDTNYYPVKKQLQKLPQKSVQLQSAFEKIFPHLSFRTDFSWAGAFATTKDGLPFIGELPGRQGCFFALGYGGNGISFSYIAACQIAAMIADETSPDRDLFSFDRTRNGTDF